MSARDVVVGGQRLRVRVDGPADAPALVFVNSLMTDLSLWDAQAAVFGGRHRIVRYDQRGHGGSAVPEEPCSFDVLVEDLAGLLQRLGVTGASVCGVSMGGVTALGLAARHPSLVARVAVCDCQPASTPAGAAAWEERIALARERGMAALAEATAARWLRPDTLGEAEGAAARVRRMVGATPIEGFVRAARALQSYDLRPDLDRLAQRGIPALFLAGEQDAALPAAMRAMAARVPGAALVLVPDCGHLPNLERPHAFDAALATLLERSSPACD